MQKYIKIYLSALGYDVGDFIPSELSGDKAVDIHHIISRGKGGKDRIENLMALTREEHERYGDKKQHMNYLLVKHYNFLNYNGVSFDENWFIKLHQKYENQY